MSRIAAITESDILEQIIAAQETPISPATARALLELRFPARELNRIRRLLRKNNSGEIEAEERIVLDKYLRVGQFLDLLHAKARLVLSKRAGTR